MIGLDLDGTLLTADKRISEEKIDVRREVFEKYPEEKYPDECSGRWL